MSANIMKSQLFEACANGVPRFDASSSSGATMPRRPSACSSRQGSKRCGSKQSVQRSSMLTALLGVFIVVAPFSLFAGYRGVAGKPTFRPTMTGSTSPNQKSKSENARPQKSQRRAFGVEFLAAPLYMEWPALAAGACAVALMVGVQLEHSLHWDYGFGRDLQGRRRGGSYDEEIEDVEKNWPPLSVDMPCNTEEGRKLMDTLNAHGQSDALFQHLQTQLLALREDVRKEMRDSKASSSTPSSCEAEEYALLSRRMDELKAKMKREEILTDIFAVGTWVKLRSKGLQTITDVDHFNGLEMHLGDSIINLPADVAMDVRAFVFNCLGAELGERTVLRLKRSNAAGLLLGAVSVGYCLARSSLKSYSSVSAVVQKGWMSESAYVMASNWAGRLVHLKPDSDDSLEQFASLRDASMDVQAEVLPTECTRVAGGHGDVMSLTVEDFRTLLGYGCSVGFTLNQWESKVANVVGKEAAAAV